MDLLQSYFSFINANEIITFTCGLTINQAETSHVVSKGDQREERVIVHKLELNLQH